MRDGGAGDSAARLSPATLPSDTAARMSTNHHRTCHFCDAMCGMIVTVDDGRVTAVRGDPDDVFSRGHICPKGPAIRDLHDDPDRLRQPMRRMADGTFAPIGWDEALDEAAERLAAIIHRDGTNAVGGYGGNPMAHSHGGALGWQAILAAVGTHNRFDANSQDSNPKVFAAMQMFGDGLSLTVPDIDRTDYFLMLGANPVVSMGSVMTLGDVRARLRGVRDRGGRVVLLDPRRNETAAICDEHHFIRPGGDAAFLLSLLDTMFTSSSMDHAALDARARGAETLRILAARFPPERTERATGVPAAVVRRIAGELLAAPRAVVYARVGVCQSELGVLASWLVEAVNVVAGHFDRPGGMMFAEPVVDIGPVARVLLGNAWGRYRSRVRGLPELGGALPSAVMAEEMETPGRGRIRGFVTYAGNPVLSTPNSERLARALAGLEFMVSVDFYLNETTRHANLILPPASPLERPHFDLVMHAVAVHNTAKYSEAVLPRTPDARDDYEILTALAARIGARRVSPANIRIRRAIEAGMLRAVPSLERVVDTLIRLGSYGDKFNPASDGLDLARVRREIHGIDLGPLRPAGRKKVRTRDGRVDLAPAVFIDASRHIEEWVDAARDGLVLIGRRHLRSGNSWMHNLPSLAKGPARDAMLVSTADAARLGLRADDAVRVTSRAGSIVARAMPTGEMMEGVVSVPHGLGHQRVAATMRVAGGLAGENVNALTDDQWVEPILGDSIFNGVQVRVERIAEDADAPRAAR